MDRGQAAHVLARIRALLAQQKTLEQTGQAVGLSKSGVHYIAVKERMPRRTKLSPETRQRILMSLREARQTQAALARLFHVAKSTINDYANRLTDRAGGRFKTRGLKEGRVCGTCGYKVKVWPCVMCAATGAKPPAPESP